MLRFQTLKVLDMNIRKSKRTLLMQFKAEYLFDWELAVWFLVQNGRHFLFRRLFLSLVYSCTFGKDIYD